MQAQVYTRQNFPRVAIAAWDYSPKIPSLSSPPRECRLVLFKEDYMSVYNIYIPPPVPSTKGLSGIPPSRTRSFNCKENYGGKEKKVNILLTVFGHHNLTYIHLSINKSIS